MEIEIKIGREVDGASAFRVPPTCKKVGRRHASLYWHNGMLTIEDDESTNGTYVNGKRIAKTRIKETDTVWLGGEGPDKACYQLDVKKVFDSCRELEKAQRTDYTKEFVQIKQAYINYQAKVAKLKQDATKKAQLPRILASFIPATIALIFFLMTLGSNDPNMMNIRIGIMVAGTAITGVVSMLTIGKNNAVNEKMSEEITELQIKYQKEYKCPKCGKEFNMNTHWKKLEAGKTCPYGCGAVFEK